MARVYGLKKATPKMKYQHMKMVLDFRADLKDSQVNAMTEGTREFMIEEIKRMMSASEAFHQWFNAVYKFRANNNMAEYEKKIRNKYYYLRRKNRTTPQASSK